jgi:hypothetical protein
LFLNNKKTITKKRTKRILLGDKAQESAVVKSQGRADKAVIWHRSRLDSRGDPDENIDESIIDNRFGKRVK